MREITVVIATYTQASEQLNTLPKLDKPYATALGNKAFLVEEGVVVSRKDGKLVAAFDPEEEETLYKITFTGLQEYTCFILQEYPDEVCTRKIANGAGILEFRKSVAAGKYVVLSQQ